MFTCLKKENKSIFKVESLKVRQLIRRLFMDYSGYKWKTTILFLTNHLTRKSKRSVPNFLIVSTDKINFAGVAYILLV